MKLADMNEDVVDRFWSQFAAPAFVHLPRATVEEYLSRLKFEFLNFKTFYCLI